MNKRELIYLEKQSLKQEIENLKERNGQLKHAVNRLQPIVDKYFLNSSDYRKRFLTVGSEWECVVRCHSSNTFHCVGELVKIGEIEDTFVWLEDSILDTYVNDSQFLLCFKPR